MKKIYFFLFLGIVVIVWLAYLMGGRVQQEKCLADVAANQVAQQTQIFKQWEEINAETNTGNTDDIRNILRQEYTIGE